MKKQNNTAMQNRRKFIKTSVLTGVGLSIMPSFSIGASAVSGKTRIALIGVGARGRTHLRNLLKRDDIIIPAICDIDPEAIQKSKEIILKAGFKMPEVYGENDLSYLKMLQRDDIDGVVISTPWLWHTRMAVDTMKAGKYTGIEVSAANTLEECWDLVNTHEETGIPLMILENVCYRRDVMAVLNMVRQDVFGELIHARCGYRHNLTKGKFRPGVTFGEGAQVEARWRTEHSIHRNGDLYPTHGAGPIANMLNINRGNRFESLTSHATKSRALHNYIVNHPAGGPDHKNAKIKWALGDVVTTQINTAKGETILVTHDTSLQRPYSLNFEVQGVNGITDFDRYHQRIYVHGVSKHHTWDDMGTNKKTGEQTESWFEKYDHPLWKKYGKQATGSGHGGMDFFVMNAFVESIKRKVNPPLDVYDAAAWSSITPLSEQSIAEGNAPQYFPDFTRGKWIKREPVFGFTDEY